MTTANSTPPIIGTSLAKRREAAADAQRRFQTDPLYDRRTPNPGPVHTPEVRRDLVWGEPVSTPKPPLVIRRPLYKRPFDIAVTLLVLLVALPVMAVIALLVRLGSPGPLLYAGERLGRDGKTFRCFKFRSMYLGADDLLEEVLADDAGKRKEFHDTAKLKDDPRITPIGNLLRRTSLDELPQLLNVLRGDMSLVGPRPVPYDESLRYGLWIEQVQTVRPGLTGAWQVSGRNDISYRERAQLDFVYSATHTLLGDLKILAKTVMVVLRPSNSGAY